MARPPYSSYRALVEYQRALVAEEHATALAIVRDGGTAKLWHPATGLVACRDPLAVAAFFASRCVKRTAQ